MDSSNKIFQAVDTCMRRIVIIVLLGLTGCSGDKKPIAETVANPATDTDFMKFVALLPKVTLPFETNCEKCCDIPKLDYDNELVKKFSASGGHGIIGLIEKTDDRVIFLVTYAADGIIPTIEVRNLQGELLGQKSFLTNYCGGDPGYYGHQYVRINPDISLTSIDTSYYFVLDSVTYNIIDTSKVEIQRKDYSIDRNGKIVENHSY